MSGRSKRTFRQSPPAGEAPRYPTLDDFDVDRRSRRDFLGRLGAIGATLLGAGALAACGERAVGTTPDAGTTMGEPALPDAGLDRQRLDTPRAQPDSWPMGGGAPAPDSRADKPRQPDAKLLEGDVAGPDARIDDLSVSPGFAPQMDAGLDSCGNPPKP